jgi:hypothetical protein
MAFSGRKMMALHTRLPIGILSFTSRMDLGLDQSIEQIIDDTTVDYR